MPKTLNSSHQKINLAGTSNTNCYYRISFNNYKLHDIICTPSQEFYVLAGLATHTTDPNLITNNGWQPTCSLQIGDILLCDRNTTLAADTKYPGIAITDIELIKQPCQVYTLEIDQTHTYLVGPNSILTHNLALESCLLFELGIAFGEGAVAGSHIGSYFGPVTCGAGLCIGGIMSIGAMYLYNGSYRTSYHLSFNTDKLDNLSKNKSKKPVISNSTYNSGNQDPKKDDDDKESSPKPVISEKDCKHMFRKKENHLPDTPENRKLLTDLCADQANRLGPDAKNTIWFAKILSDGKQLWAGIRDGQIRYGGLNEIPKGYNTITGLCKISK